MIEKKKLSSERTSSTLVVSLFQLHLISSWQETKLPSYGEKMILYGELGLERKEEDSDMLE